MNHKIAYCHFSATLKIPDNLPTYKKNAFTIFHQLVSRIDELNLEMNHRKIQVASLFASIQQVETEICKEQETTEQHNRNKALSNLRKARFMKQMENLTKELKQQTVLTHSYPMPKSTNTAELTKKLPDDSPDELLVPDVTKDLEQELTKLGLNITSLTNTNSGTNKRTSEDTHQCKLSASSTSTPPESTTILSTEKTTCEHKDLQQFKQTHQCEDTKELPSQKSSQPQVLSPCNHNEDTGKGIDAVERQPHIKTSSKSPSEEYNFESPKVPRTLSRNDHIEAYPWAHEASKNFHKTTPLASNEEIVFLNLSFKEINNFTIEQKKQMRQPIHLTDAALRKIEANIGMIKHDKGNIYTCKVCDPGTPFQCTKRTKMKRHIRMHLGYAFYRCSFCNIISNNLNTITKHYVHTHGIPKIWIVSPKM